MTEQRTERFELRLTPRETSQVQMLATRLGLSMADIFRLGLRRVLADAGGKRQVHLAELSLDVEDGGDNA